jgi:hypothetical protein
MSSDFPVCVWAPHFRPHTGLCGVGPYTTQYYNILYNP